MHVFVPIAFFMLVCSFVVLPAIGLRLIVKSIPDTNVSMLCLNCRYDLSAHFRGGPSATCPECGLKSTQGVQTGPVRNFHRGLLIGGIVLFLWPVILLGGAVVVGILG